MHMEFINTVYLLIYRIIKSGDYDLVVMVMACEDPFLNYSPLCFDCPQYVLFCWKPPQKEYKSGLKARGAIVSRIAEWQ